MKMLLIIEQFLNTKSKSCGSANKKKHAGKKPKTVIDFIVRTTAASRDCVTLNKYSIIWPLYDLQG